MPEGQDFLSLGLDISTWDSQKMATLNQYIKLFDQLSKYDGKVINPILGAGIGELNTSISATNKILDDINSKLSQFTTNTNAASNATRGAASSSKLLTEEQAKEKIQTQELNRLKLEQAKADNLMVQSRVNANKAIKEQLAAESQLAKQQESDSKLISKLKQQEIANDARSQKELEKQRRANEAELKRSTIASKKEQQANALLENNYRQLTITLKNQAEAYRNLYLTKGKNSAESKIALSNYADTAQAIDKVDRSLQSAQPQAFGLGKGLSTIYNRLRIIAYILPGIGIAGIFSLLFEGLEKIGDAIASVDKNVNEVIKDQERHNKVLSEQIAIINNLSKEELEYIKNINAARGIRPGEEGRVSVSPENKEKEDQARGLDAVTLATDKLRIAREKLETSTYQLDKRRTTGFSTNAYYIIPDKRETDEELSRRLEKQKDDSFADIAGKSLELDRLKKEADDLATKLAKSKAFRISDNFPGQSAIKKNEINKRLEIVDNLIKEKQTSLDLSKEIYGGLESDLNSFYSAKKDASDESLAYQKLISDQERALYINNSKSEISVQKAKSSQILSDIRSTHEERIKSIEEEKAQQVELNRLDKVDVINNTSSTKYEKSAATKKETDENIKANIKRDQDILSENISFYQRQLKAQIEHQKNEVQEQATNNSKIQNNLRASLSERLGAYSSYITERTKLQELEFELYSSAGKSSAEDRATSLTNEEVKKLRSDRDKEIASAKANAEVEIYDIVYTSGQKQLKSIKDEYEAEQTYSKTNLINDLNANNEKYDRREESLKKWQRNKKRIEEKDRKEEFEKDLQKEESEFRRLQELRSERASNVVKSQKLLDNANLLPDGDGKKFEIDKATGNNDANVQLLKDTEKELVKVGKAAENTRFKMANLPKTAKEGLIELVQIISAIENELYKDIKSFADQGYEYRLSLLEKNKAIIDEQYEHERNAIQASSLSQKDKAALDIQILEQKKEYDKKAQADERQIKIKQAEFDKKLAIAHIIIGTAAAVIEGVPPSPKSFAAGVIGALQLATAIATPIPSFAEGVLDFEGGVARYGEAGIEVVKEPGKRARLVHTETISYLPKGTDIIPVKDSPIFEEKISNEGWDQTLFLAKEIRKSRQKSTNTTTIIKIDLGFENYKKRVLGNG